MSARAGGNPWEPRTVALFRVRDLGTVVTTCGAWWSPSGELRRCRPVVTGVVRCNPVDCGPDVAPPVTSLEGASGHSAQPGCFADGAAQRPARLTAVVRGDRQGPVLRARRGHGRRGRRWLRPGSNVLQLDRRVKSVLGDHLPPGQAPEGARHPCKCRNGKRRGRPALAVCGVSGVIAAYRTVSRLGAAGGATARRPLRRAAPAG